MPLTVFIWIRIKTESCIFVRITAVYFSHLNGLFSFAFDTFPCLRLYLVAYGSAAHCLDFLEKRDAPDGGTSAEVLSAGALLMMQTILLSFDFLAMDSFGVSGGRIRIVFFVVGLAGLALGAKRDVLPIDERREQRLGERL